MQPAQNIDINALKAQVDEEIAARLLIEADFARYTQRRALRIGELKLLVPLEATSEVLEMPPLYRLPGAPTGIMGLANRHGRVVPVLDLSEFFGKRVERVARSWLLICGRGDEAIGLVIDSLPERKSFVQDDETSLSQIQHPIKNYARKAYRAGKDIWIDIETGEFFDKIFNVET